MGNIFKFTNPETWHCRVNRLAPGHGMLIIELSSQEEDSKVKQLQFGHVNHFSGWTA